MRYHWKSTASMFKPMYQLYINHISILIHNYWSEWKICISKGTNSQALICSSYLFPRSFTGVVTRSLCLLHEAVGPSGLWDGGFSPTSQENTQQDKGASLHGKLDQRHGKKPCLFRPPCDATFLTSAMPRPRTAWGADGVHPQQQSISWVDWLRSEPKFSETRSVIPISLATVFAVS